jgi:hypothetical protein
MHTQDSFEVQKKLGSQFRGCTPPAHVVALGGVQCVDVAVSVIVVVAVDVGRVNVTTVFGTDRAAFGASVRVVVDVVLTTGRFVTVEVLQPAIVSMQRQSVLTKDAACFRKDEKTGTSLSFASRTVIAAAAACGQDVMVVDTLLVFVTTTVEGVPGGSVSLGPYLVLKMWRGCRTHNAWKSVTVDSYP